MADTLAARLARQRNLGVDALTTTTAAIVERFTSTPALFGYLDTHEEEEELTRLLELWKGAVKPGTSELPRMYIPHSSLREATTVIQEKFLELVAEAHLIRMSTASIENSHLESLWASLQHFAEPSDKFANKSVINYVQYKECGAHVAKDHAHLQALLTPQLFMMLPKDDRGRVSIDDLFDCIMSKVSTQQIRLTLCSYDPRGSGFIGEKDLEAFLLEQINYCPQLASLDEEFHSIYAVYAARRFLFVLDPKRTGRIRIVDLMASAVLSEFTEMQQTTAERVTAPNWFAVDFVTRVHTMYIKLDTDHNGLLSPSEFARYGGGYLTAVFVDRIFQECTTYNGEIDYKVYLDFVLAQEFRNTPQALKYYFRLLDIRHQGYLDAFTLNYFWRAILNHPKNGDWGQIPFSHIYAEVIDMIKPADGCRIFEKDLIACGCGDEVVGMLTDVLKLYNHENKEYALASGPGTQSSQSDPDHVDETEHYEGSPGLQQEDDYLAEEFDEPSD